jgi:oligoribonuclease
MQAELTKSHLNLVWIDCEMTGLDFDNDSLLEVAVVITSPDLELFAQGPSLVIHQPDDVLERMGDWCQVQHRKSHLYTDVQQSRVTLADAQKQILDFLVKYCEPRTSPLCGSTIWTDRIFLMKHMPELNAFLHYRNMDVSSIKELAFRWYGFATEKNSKNDLHRALPDIYDSIKELKLYRDNFFIPIFPPVADAPSK